MSSLAEAPAPILGVDITTTPSRAKPIWVAAGTLQADRLDVLTLTACTTREAFLDLLAAPGPWFAGLDMPFGQPATFVEATGLGQDWESTVRAVGALGVEGYAQVVRAYQAAQPPGRKEPKRATDRTRPGAFSPIKVFRPAVGRMFASWAPALSDSGANILPCRPTSDPRTLVEVFPGSLARHLGETHYKGPGQERYEARQRLLVKLRAGEALLGFRVVVRLTVEQQLQFDPEADLLDAVLACALAAWAKRNPEVPPDVDRAEGWIFGP